MIVSVLLDQNTKTRSLADSLVKPYSSELLF